MTAIREALAELVAMYDSDESRNGDWYVKYSGVWAKARAALAAQPSQGEPLTECADNDSPWLICKACAGTGKCKLAAQPAKKVCRGIPRVGCNYLAECDTVCNKCGQVHDAHHIAAQPAQWWGDLSVGTGGFLTNDPQLSHGLTSLYSAPVAALAGHTPAECARNELVVAIHTLASHFENAFYAFRDDAEALRTAKGDIAWAMKIAAKHNQNGPGCALAAQPTDEDIDALDQSMCGEREFAIPFARAVLAWRDSDRKL